jgi:DNA-binding transcriptional regulator YiaG
MSELTRILRNEITRVAKKEARWLVAPTRKSSIAAKQGLVALKRRVAELERAVSNLKRSSKGVAAVGKPADAGRRIRFSARSVRAQRERLGMSAEDFGKLLGVSSQSIYNWEHGTAKPRSALLDKLAVVRAIGKREALARLRSLNGSDERA